MITWVKSILFKLLPLQTYLSVVSWVYIKLTQMGFFRKQYPELFYLKNIVKPNDTVLDIGANLGYYSLKLAQLVGANGKVLMVEPVPIFQKILIKNTKNHKHIVELLPYALGNNEQTVFFDSPLLHGNYSHGRTQLNNKENKGFEVEMKLPQQLFEQYKKIHFIKCDVEGYEAQLLPCFKELIQRWKPIIQIEISQENKKVIFEFFKEIEYIIFYLSNNALVQVELQEMIAQTDQQDYYAKPII